MSKIFGAHIPTEIKNLAINGGLDFWQAVGSATTTANTAATVNGYTADMIAYLSIGSTVKNYSILQSTNVPTITQSGFQSSYSYLFNMITAIPTFAAGDAIEPFRYNMEGFDFAKITSKLITVGFWMIASVAGTYSISFSNNIYTRSYVTTFTMNGANTYQFVTVTIPLDSQTSSYTFTNSATFSVVIAGLAGSTYQTAVLNTWATGTFISATTVTNYAATAGASFNIAQFSITEGPLGFSSIGFQKTGKTIQQELAMCQRYFCTVFATNSSPLPVYFNRYFPTPMRTIPTITVISGSTGNADIQSVNISQWRSPNGVACTTGPTDFIISADARM